MAVNPEHIRIELFGLSHTVWTIAHADCLVARVIDPGEVVQGLVIYRANIQTVAKVRVQGAGTIRYTDPALRVDYP